MKKVMTWILALCFVCALTACAGSPSSTNSAEEVTTNNDASAEVSEQTTPQEEETKPTTLVGIPGSNAADIRIGLEDAGGIPKGEIEDAADTSLSTKYCSSSTEIAGTGVSLSYNLSLDADEAITMAVFSVVSYQVAADEDLLEFAKSYLSYCASMPYDTADSASAQEWVTTNLADYANSPKTTIGDATFKLAGTVNPNTGRLVDLTLTIVPANIDEQIQTITSEE